MMALNIVERVKKLLIVVCSVLLVTIWNRTSEATTHNVKRLITNARKRS